MYFSALIISVLICIKTACALECYVTDPQSALSDNPKFVTQDCAENLKQMGRSYSDLILEAVQLHCYKVVIESVSGDMRAVVKGCVPKGGCELVKTTLEARTGTSAAAQCYECEGDRCNSAPKNTIFVGFVAFVALIVMM